MAQTIAAHGGSSDGTIRLVCQHGNVLKLSPQERPRNGVAMQVKRRLPLPGRYPRRNAKRPAELQAVDLIGCGGRI